MAQIIVILNDRELTKILHASLSRRYGIDVIAKPNAQDALSMLELVPVELVICVEKREQESTAFKICNYIQANKLETSVITLGNKTSGLKKEFALPVNTTHEELIHRAAFITGKEVSDWLPKPQEMEKEKEKEETEEKESVGEKTTVFQLPKLNKIVPEIKTDTPEYHSFHLKYFLHLEVNETLNFGVYSRIKKKDSFEYSEKIHSGTTLTKEILHSLAMRTGKELFVKEEDFKTANEFLSYGLLKKFTNQQLPIEERLHLNSDGHEILMDVFKHSTFNKYSVEIIKEMVKSIDLLMKTPNPIPSFLNTLKEKKVSYGYAHIHLTCLLIFMMIDRFPWSKDQSKNKIIYLSLFHDLCLHNERMIRLHHHFHTEQSHLNEEERQLILQHADASAVLLESIVKAPKELTNLIREHHGLKSGKGFVESLSISINPLSMAFIVCEDFVTHYLDMAEKEEKEISPSQLETLYNQLKEKYQQMTYKEVVLELPKIFTPG